MWGTEEHMNYFHIHFLAPTQNIQLWAPRRSLCASFPGKGRKQGTHINFPGGFLGQKGGPKQAIFGHNIFVSWLFFSAKDQKGPHKRGIHRAISENFF